MALQSAETRDFPAFASIRCTRLSAIPRSFPTFLAFPALWLARATTPRSAFTLFLRMAFIFLSSFSAPQIPLLSFPSSQSAPAKPLGDVTTHRPEQVSVVQASPSSHSAALVHGVLAARTLAA